MSKESINKVLAEQRAASKAYAEKIIADLKDLGKQFSAELAKLNARKKKAEKYTDLPINTQIEFLTDLKTYVKEQIDLHKEIFVKPPKKKKAKKR